MRSSSSLWKADNSAEYILVGLFTTLAGVAAYVSDITGYKYPLILLICPVIVSAILYGRRVYGVMLGISMVTAVLVIVGTGTHTLAGSLQPLGAILLVGAVIFLACEMILHLSQHPTRAVAIAREEEAKYRMLFEIGPEPMFIYDVNSLQFLAVNNAAIELHGFSRDELLSMKLSDLVHPDEEARLRSGVERFKLALSSNQRSHDSSAETFHASGIWRLRSKNGSTLWARGFSQTIRFGAYQARLVVAQDLTESKRAEDEVRSVTARARCILWKANVSGNSDGYHWEFVIPDEEAAQRLVPIDVPPGRRYTDEWFDSKLPKDQGRCGANCRSALESGKESYTQEYRCMIRNGEVRWFAESVRIEALQPNHWRLVGVCTDITERRQAEEALRASEERYRGLVEMSPDAIGIHSGGRFVYVNEAMIQLLGGADSTQLVGRAIMDFAHPDFHQVVRARVDNIEQKLQSVPLIEEKFVRLDGTFVDVEVTAIPFEHDGRPATQVICRDITRRKQVEEIIWRQAYHDSLTALPNRRLFNDRLALAVVRARRTQGAVAVIFLDLDDFKVVNDTLGHSGGDEMLKKMADRLAACLRESDTVARMGGDEFTILLPDIKDQDDAVNMAERLLQSVRQPFILDGHELCAAASIGISMYPEDGDDAASLLRNADTALYRAKEQGKNHYQMFTPWMHEKAAERISLEHRLQRALERGEFFIDYQPQVNVRTGNLVGVEALVRWRSPELGLVPPSRFIPVAEGNGFMVPLGEWVLRTACMQTQSWRETGFDPIRLAVNLSARQFRQAGFVEMVSAVVEETRLDPRCLQLEMTENMVMHYVDDTIAKLRDLKQLGITVAIDNFGSGCSSLGDLKRFDVSTLKIDQCFVQNIKSGIGSQPGDTAIVRAIIGLAQSLEVSVIAEGVETEAQANFLRSINCEEMQGFHVGLPQCAENLERSHLVQAGVSPTGLNRSSSPPGLGVGGQR